MCSLRHVVKLIIFGFVMTSIGVYADVKTLMLIPGIDGEYQGSRYEGWIEVERFSGDIEEGGCDVFSVEKALDSTSASILASSVLRTFFDTIRIEVVRPGGDGAPVPTSRFTLENAVISRVTTSVQSGDVSASEELDLEAGALRLDAFQQQPDGTVVLVGTANVECNKIKK